MITMDFQLKPGQSHPFKSSVWSFQAVAIEAAIQVLLYVPAIVLTQLDTSELSDSKVSLTLLMQSDMLLKKSALED